MKLGYNTNGTTFHRWQDALELMAEIGYRSVAITIDHDCLNPFADGFEDEVGAMRHLLDCLELSSVIETGARFLLNPRIKHEPTLVSPMPEQRQRRLDFLKRCVDIAAELESDAVSFWSGACRSHVTQDEAWSRLVEGCSRLSEYAANRQVRLAFEPEPGMLIERMDQFARLVDQLRAPDHFGLTVDIGHLHCVEEPGTLGDHLRYWATKIFNMHIEDMKRQRHEHLRFGEGEIDFSTVFAALTQIGYTGPVHVELSRHGFMAPEVMVESFEFLQVYMDASAS